MLIKDRLALESMRSIDVVLFDKTGTLTRGNPSVEQVEVVGEWTAEQVLKLAAAAESSSEHPLAKAIVRSAKDRGIDVPEVVDFSSSPAVGVQGTVEGATIRVGGPSLLEEEKLDSLPIVGEWSGQGAIILHVIKNSKSDRCAKAVR